MNDELKVVLHQNPKAAEELESLKEAMTALNKLREAGVARGPQPLMLPHSGRYSFGGTTKSVRRVIKGSSKLTNNA